MRGFPFGALSSFERLAYSKIKRPCAEREAPHANSLSGAGCCPIEPNETIGKLFRASFAPHASSLPDVGASFHESLTGQRTEVWPPSTGINWPVMNQEASEARNTMTGPRCLSGSPYWPPM